MKDIILVGFGGHAKSVADTIERQNEYRIIGYTDIKDHNSIYKYLGTDDVLQEYYDKGIRYAFVGIGYLGKGQIREKIFNKLKSIGYTIPIISDPSAIISSSAIIGEGTFVGKYSVINAEAQVGKMVIINSKALIEHETRVEDFCHIAVDAVLCGQVSVGRSTFVGANATIIQCINIEENKIIPAGVTIR